MPRPRRKNQTKPRYVESESSEWSADEGTTSGKRGGPSKDEVPAKKKQKTSEETSGSTGRSTSDISMRDPSPETPATSEGEESEDEQGRSFYYKDLKTIDDVLEDFKVSYVGTLKFDEPENVSPTPAYEIPERPVYREEDIPKGWTPIDNGIDKNDVNALIKRCRERIAENIRPHIFEQRLKNLLERKAREDKLIAAEPAGLSWHVVQRLDELTRMKKWLKEKGDEFNYIPTVDAVMQAYRKKTLDWNLGLVTYWLDGRQICEPRLHDLGVLSILTEDPRYKKGVWVEGTRLIGARPPVPTNLNAMPGNQYRLYANNARAKGWVDNQGQGRPMSGNALCYETTAEEGPFQVKMNLHLKLGNPIGSGFTFEFSDDTGADFMTLYRDDLFCMYNADKFCLEDCLDPGTSGNLEFIVPVLGVIQSWLGDGSSTFSYVAIVGMNLEHPNPDLANDGVPWREDYLPVETLVRDGNIETGLAPRLNGPAIRTLYPTVSSNTDSLRLYVVSSLEKASREYVKHMSDDLEGSGKKIPSLQHKMLEKEVGTTSQIPKGGVH